MGCSVTKVDIHLDRPGIDYRPNDTVSGQCLVYTDSPISLSELSVKLKGEARCEWSEDRQISDGQDSDGQPITRTETVYYTANYLCVKLKYYPGNVNPSTLSPGQHNIGFSFLLPAGGLPSTFKGQYGYIGYWIEARIRNPDCCGSDGRSRVPIVVNSPALSSIQELSQPVVNSNQKTVGLINGKPLFMKCQIDSTGHTIGTNISIHCFIDNQSDKPMTLKAQLRQDVTYYATGDQRKSSEKLARYVGPTIGPRQLTTETMNLLVPVTAPVVHNTCPIIHVKYLIVLTLWIPGSFDLHCKLPVILTQ
ncbi:arrestin domain-containing protein 3-like [Oppia nitens]|uniref:arrestin domain-containing protein 3-like n=1 Tax=Oppia nitens TaxID=1686743 RepID=UPI0023D9F4B3|nr:arrestin domain-containing protein 3-like [Oppia nitens]